MKAWEIAGVCIAVAIGAAVGTAYIIADAVNKMIDADIDWPTFERAAPR